MVYHPVMLQALALPHITSATTPNTQPITHLPSPITQHPTSNTQIPHRSRVSFSTILTQLLSALPHQRFETRWHYFRIVGGMKQQNDNTENEKTTSTLIPEQRKGSETGARHEVQLTSRVAALELFKTAKSRLLNVNS